MQIQNLLTAFFTISTIASAAPINPSQEHGSMMNIPVLRTREHGSMFDVPVLRTRTSSN